MEAIVQIFIVTAGWDYEGDCNQWIFADEATARVRYDSVVEDLRRGLREAGDYVTLKGPFALGESTVTGYKSPKNVAYFNPSDEARAAAEARAKAKRVAKKAAEPTDGYAAMRTNDGG